MPDFKYSMHSNESEDYIRESQVYHKSKCMCEKRGNIAKSVKKVKSQNQASSENVAMPPACLLKPEKS